MPPHLGLARGAHSNAAASPVNRTCGDKRWHDGRERFNDDGKYSSLLRVYCGSISSKNSRNNRGRSPFSRASQSDVCDL